jgi:hypothetical protein
MIAIIFEILFFYFLFTDPTQIGIFETPFLLVYGIYIEIFLIVFLLTVVITGILFGQQTMKSDNPELKLKGKFLIIAFIFFSTGAFMDSIIPELFMLARIILILSALSFYCGFILPNWIKEKLIE